MEKQKRWHLFLILTVIALTVYNVLPTVFYYTKPLAQPVTQSMAIDVGSHSLERVNSLEQRSEAWLKSFCKLLNAPIAKISVDAENPQFIDVTFKNEKDAQRVSRFLPRAGSLIPFTPAQLSLSSASKGTTVRVQRSIPVRFAADKPNTYFEFAQKYTTPGELSPLFKKVYSDRMESLLSALSGTSENAQLVTAAIKAQSEKSNEYAFALAERINTYTALFGQHPELLKRFLGTFTQGSFPKGKEEALASFKNALSIANDSLRMDRSRLKSQLEKESDDITKEELAQSIQQIEAREASMLSAIGTLKSKHAFFLATPKQWQHHTLHSLAQKEAVSLLPVSPLFDTLSLNAEQSELTLSLQKDVLALLRAYENEPAEKQNAQKLTQLIYNEIARVSRESGEAFTPRKETFTTSLATLTDSTGMLVFNLEAIAQEKTQQLLRLLRNEWNPVSKELQGERYPIVSEEEYSALPASGKRFALVVKAPIISGADDTFRPSSLYVVAKGMNSLIAKAENNPNAPSSVSLRNDLRSLQELMKKSGLIGYPGSAVSHNTTLTNDLIFEEEEYFQTILAATRENFTVHGTKRYATLDFTTVEQRILTQNKIDDAIHEDLLKWRDEYVAAQVNPNLHAKYDVPKPTESPFFSNIALSAKKYFRGDDRKVLHWGLDLSGGKTVQIELRDSNNRVVRNEEDLKQGINELYRRVNKMGVSEVSIRQEGTNITLDFPGSQNLSATDLVKASSMFFHIVNERFSLENKQLSDHTSQFLQDIWNEAVVTGQKDMESINRIAWSHLYGDSLETASPRSNAAKALYAAGLRLANPDVDSRSSEFSEKLSMIAMYRGDSFTEWYGQTNPLLIVFNNYVIEGASLENVHAAYDQTKGNYLSFEIKGSHMQRSGSKISPRADMFTWTNHFSKESVADSSLGELTNGKGWRMAVVLNGSVISAPTLDSPLERSAMISGSFTQREANKLEADLKAGSLTFTPQILSEKNVSPELGVKDRVKGISATILALGLVIALMVGYYRFAGIVASIAVLFNLLIMWAALQNIQATMTLAGIAGVILTLGMAVDANVLVFERIREEYAKTGRIASAVRLGYSKAFSAILDSNVTTIIAAVILLNFDSGPIKGLALSLIIGIAASMFTALFMTRYFFTGWVQNPKNATLTMAQWFKRPNFRFIKFAPLFIGLTILVSIAGGYFGAKDRSSLMGMDFTGGFSMQVEITPQEGISYREAVEKALNKAGISNQEMSVRELSPSNTLKILLSNTLNEASKPFANMPMEVKVEDSLYAYESNPRIEYVVKALEKSGLDITESAKKHLENNWTSVSGQMSDAMREQALYGLGIALLCILAYIAIRFEFTYALAATLGLVVDVSFTLGFIALLHAIGVPVQVDLKVIAALMTIIGYSLNDTIIIFDRIREDAQLDKKSPLRTIVEGALNTTLSRTVMTSTTTLVVLIALITLGGQTIFGLSLVMIIGVCYGTLSSLFVSAPLLLYFHSLATKKKSRNLTTLS